MDPYKVLGILPHSSEAELKDAYSHVVETYNINDLEDDSVKSFYEEKLNEANEAYRIITHNMTCEEVRDLIEKDDFIVAETKLNMISDLSSAEWNYLKGILLIKKGWIDSGVNHIRKATTLNPYNTEYTSALRRLNQKVGTFRGNYNQASKQSGNSLCNGIGGGGNSNNSGGLC